MSPLAQEIAMVVIDARLVELRAEADAIAQIEARSSNDTSKWRHGYNIIVAKIAALEAHAILIS